METRPYGDGGIGVDGERDIAKTLRDELSGRGFRDEFAGVNG
jgi:hypothetical protein